MEQLDFFDCLDKAKNIAVRVKDSALKKVKKMLSQRKKPDLVIFINKKRRFDSLSKTGLVKVELLNNCGILDGIPGRISAKGEGFPDLERIDVIGYVRGDIEDPFRLLDDTIISYGFAPEAEKKLNTFKKEFKRKNIALRVDVREEDLIVSKN